jgi:hypothetical protein
MSVLQEILPPDMLEYCQEHGLLDSILIPPAESSTLRSLSSGEEF